MSLYVWRGFGINEIEQTKKAKIRTAQFLAVGRTISQCSISWYLSSGGILVVVDSMASLDEKSVHIFSGVD